MLRKGTSVSPPQIQGHTDHKLSKTISSNETGPNQSHVTQLFQSFKLSSHLSVAFGLV